MDYVQLLSLKFQNYVLKKERSEVNNVMIFLYILFSNENREAFFSWKTGNKENKKTRKNEFRLKQEQSHLDIKIVIMTKH